jgi:multimeric flavodoxin WrbA
MNNMPVVTSQYWNQIHGNTREQALQDAEGLQTMRTLGMNMAWLLKCIEAGKNAGIEKPKYEPVIATNFIR